MILVTGDTFKFSQDGRFCNIIHKVKFFFGVRLESCNLFLSVLKRVFSHFGDIIFNLNTKFLRTYVSGVIQSFTRKQLPAKLRKIVEHCFECSPFSEKPISNTRFFNEQHFFPFSLSVAELFHELRFKCCLGNTYKHHHTETLSKFAIFVSMSRPRSIYVISSMIDLGLFMSYLCDHFFIFIFIFIMINRVIS